MAKEKKRLSKNAKTAKKLLNDSKLLAATKAIQAISSGQEFDSSVITPRTSPVKKPRPQKKRG